jgi:D-amino-acid dehydrogenase
MKVTILGSGVIGVSTAYYLARAGHEVTVVDRQQEPAMETSFANAGQISPGYSAPWAAPGMPIKAVKWLLQDHSPLVIRLVPDPAMWIWALKLVANCTESAYARNKERMLRLATYSGESVTALREEIGLEYDERSRGTLQLFRKQQQVDASAKDIAVLEQCGVAYELLDADGCARAEPALGLVKDKIAGGLRLPADQTGDCFKYTQRLAEHCKGMGVDFQMGVTIQRLVRDGDRLLGVETDRERLQADAFVLALGSYSPLLLKPIGIKIPIYPVKGYSITVPITNPDGAPVSTVMDETHKVAVTRLGERIRVAGTAELGGYDLRLNPKRRRTVDHVVTDLFPTGGDVAKAEFWAGLRPMTPDGTPVIGATPVKGLYLNTGHGTLGWTMGPGSGRVLADLVSGRKADISLDGLGMDRYQ